MTQRPIRIFLIILIASAMLATCGLRAAEAPSGTSASEATPSPAPAPTPAAAPATKSDSDPTPAPPPDPVPAPGDAATTIDMQLLRRRVERDMHERLRRESGTSRTHPHSDGNRLPPLEELEAMARLLKAVADADGSLDGKLDASEKEAAKAAIQRLKNDPGTREMLDALKQHVISPPPARKQVPAAPPAPNTPPAP